MKEQTDLARELLKRGAEYLRRGADQTLFSQSDQHYAQHVVETLLPEILEEILIERAEK